MLLISSFPWQLTVSQFCLGMLWKMYKIYLGIFFSRVVISRFLPPVLMSFSMESQLLWMSKFSYFQGSWISEKLLQASQVTVEKSENRERNTAEQLRSGTVRFSLCLHKDRCTGVPAASQKCFMFIFIFIPTKTAFAFWFLLWLIKSSDMCYLVFRWLGFPRYVSLINF